MPDARKAVVTGSVHGSAEVKLLGSVRKLSRANTRPPKPARLSVTRIGAPSKRRIRVLVTTSRGEQKEDQCGNHDIKPAL